MKRIFIKLKAPFLLTLFALAAAFLPITVFAGISCTPSATQQCCGNIPVGIGVGTCNTSQGGVIMGYVKQIIRFASGLVGSIIVGFVLFGGLTYITARGSSSQVEKAVAIIRNAILALICFIFLVAITNFLVPGGLFTFNVQKHYIGYSYVA